MICQSATGRTGMTYRCAGCASASFYTAKGLASHRRRCLPYKALPTCALRARLGNFRQNQQNSLPVRDAVQVQVSAAVEDPVGMEVDGDGELQVSLYRSLSFPIFLLTALLVAPS